MTEESMSALTLDWDEIVDLCPLYIIKPSATVCLPPELLLSDSGLFLAHLKVIGSGSLQSSQRKHLLPLPVCGTARVREGQQARDLDSRCRDESVKIS
ncbi:hypothetical protein MHYP_G00141350 [Metynnis hypsauchen]